MVHKGDTVALIDSPEVRAKLAQANAIKAVASSQSRKAQNGARKEQIAGAYELYQQALVQEDVMKKSFDRIQKLYDGIISALFPKVGELVGQGAPVASVTDLNDVWFTFNVREDYLHGMKQGDKITVIIPALDGKEVPATINYVAVRESYATWKATKETGMYDAKTFEVRAVPDVTVDGVRPGMSAIVK